MKYSIITTCKNRLVHLRETLPTFVAQLDCEVVVVDYDCPEKTREYVREHFPQVKTVEVDDQPRFRATHARNLGAAVAQGDYLAFIDADVSLVPDFTRNLELEPNRFGIFNFVNDARGSCVVGRSMFEDVGGYDEVIFGYSQEDLELYMRLNLAGYRPSIMPQELVAKIEQHSNEMRTTYFDMGRKLAYARGKIYRDAKNFMLLIGRRKELPQDAREALWEKINQMLAAPNLFDGSHSLDIPLPVADGSTFLPGSLFSGAIRLTIDLRK